MKWLGDLEAPESTALLPYSCRSPVPADAVAGTSSVQPQPGPSVKRRSADAEDNELDSVEFDMDQFVVSQVTPTFVRLKHTI